LKILITGVAGFVGFKLAEYFRREDKSIVLFGIDNLSRKGSEYNLELLEKLNCVFYKGDISKQNDVDALPTVDWIIDCAANPSVLAGLDGGGLDLIQNNLTGTFYLLEKCKRDHAGFIMLSTSRVYSIENLKRIPLEVSGNSFFITPHASYPLGFSSKGVAEDFSTSSPISLYGATKLASEVLAMEYHYTFGFPVWINRCGVIAGPGQFGKIDQGIFSFWIYQYILNKPLSFIGFGGNGFQARDMLHPWDVFQMVQMQLSDQQSLSPRIVNLGGGVQNTLSLAQLDAFCKSQIDPHKQINRIEQNRNFDIPFYATDYSKATEFWNWRPSFTSMQILEQIVGYAYDHVDHIMKIS
jgi:CDP-paratose 2-epimerase